MYVCKYVSFALLLLILCMYHQVHVIYVIHTYMYGVYLTLHSPHFKDDKALQESGIYSGQLLILEVKKDDECWPKDTYTQDSPNVTTQLEECRPLLDARLQEYDIWYVSTCISYFLIVDFENFP